MYIPQTHSLKHFLSEIIDTDTGSDSVIIAHKCLIEILKLIPNMDVSSYPCGAEGSVGHEAGRGGGKRIRV